MHSAIYAAVRCPSVCPFFCHISVTFSYVIITGTSVDFWFRRCPRNFRDNPNRTIKSHDPLRASI